MISSIEDIVDLHASCGNIEDTYLRLHFDNKVMLLNKYTLRVRRGNALTQEIKMSGNKKDFSKSFNQARDRRSQEQLKQLIDDIKKCKMAIKM